MRRRCSAGATGEVPAILTHVIKTCYTVSESITLMDKSSAHLSLLSKIITRKEIGDSALSDNIWSHVLGEGAQDAIKRFVDENLLECADLGGLLDFKFKATELKDMLKQRGLPVSGRKGDLIARLTQADSEAMQKAIHGLTVLKCTEKGRELAEQYLAKEQEKKEYAERLALDALRAYDFKTACMLSASYEAENLFPREPLILGQTYDPTRAAAGWKEYNPAEDVEMLKKIFECKPKILARLNNDQLNLVRIAAGMTHLWCSGEGESWLPFWLPGDFKTELSMDSAAAPRMILFYLDHLTDLETYRNTGIKIVEIMTSDPGDPHCCTACRKIEKRKCRVDEVPEFPNENCTSALGCRCEAVPVVTDL